MFRLLEAIIWPAAIACAQLTASALIVRATSNAFWELEPTGFGAFLVVMMTLAILSPPLIGFGASWVLTQPSRDTQIGKELLIASTVALVITLFSLIVLAIYVVPFVLFGDSW